MSKVGTWSRNFLSNKAIKSHVYSLNYFISTRIHLHSCARLTKTKISDTNIAVHI